MNCSKTKEWNYIIVYPESHQHLGLFEDLKKVSNVRLIPTEQKKLSGKLKNNLKRFHTSWMINKRFNLPLKRIWFKTIHWNITKEEKNCIVIVDSAMKALSIKELNNLSKRKNIRVVLVLVNSMDAKSIAILEIKRKIFSVSWDDVYTFDEEDARKYRFKNLGCCYYSMESRKYIEESNPGTENSDVYFTGGLKGGRERTILEVFEKLQKEKINAKFDIMISGEQRLKRQIYDEQIHYYSGGWIPYKEVLANVLHTNVIIEILQVEQAGPSLRYYEAVCYNKKLLTNNPNITCYPYYDARFMKVFHTIEEVDMDWIRSNEDIDYRYNGEFSPTHLLEVVIK